MHKKLFTLFALISIILCSCSEKENKQYKIGISQCSQDEWREAANQEFIREASFYKDMEIEIRSVSDDSEAQIKDVEYFISEKVDLLVISPNEATALTPVVEKAYKSGIPVILYDRKIKSDSFTSYVGADNRQIGWHIGDYVLSKLVPSGKSKSSRQTNIIIVRGTKGSTADNERYEGLISAIKELDTQNRINILATTYGNFQKDDAFRQMKSILANNVGKDINVVIALNDRMASGVYEAFLEGNYYGEFPAIIGVDALAGKNGGLEMILKGEIMASFLYPTGGETVIDVARRILTGVAVKNFNILNTAAIDITNARIIKLQNEQIALRQNKFDRLNESLQSNHRSLMIYKRNFTLLLLVTIIIIIAGSLILVMYRVNIRLNKQLNDQNKQIRRHVDELESQKTKLIELSQQLEEATNAKLVFFTNISHEFKTPLTLILGPVQELLKDNGLKPEVKDSLKVINRNASRLFSLINEILEFRTIENGKMPVTYTNTNLRTFITGLNDLINDYLHRKKVSFRFISEDTDYNMAIDSKKMEKIYFNLISNAIKHVDNGGSITTTLNRITNESSDNLILTVHNSGSYIPEDKLKDVFLRFYKIGEDSHNTGIGLALTYQLVNLLEGNIDVESSEEKGTTFTVRIPVHPAMPDQEETPSYTFTINRLSTEMFEGRDDEADIEEATGRDKEKVLIIDDNPDILKYASDILRSDYHIITSDNGTKGLEKAQCYNPDVIICDIMMPEIDGFEVCRNIKQNARTSTIPVILLTASSLDEHKEKGYEYGADAYMQKPFSAKVLKVRIRKLIDKMKSINQSIGNEWLIGDKHKITDEGAQLLSKIKTYVEAHIQEEISIDEMVQELGVSKSNFYRKLKNITDWSPVDIINLIRLRRTVNLVIHQGMNLSQASTESGFNSLSYFSRTFVKYYHISARDWIKQQLGK